MTVGEHHQHGNLLVALLPRVGAGVGAGEGLGVGAAEMHQGTSA